MEEEESKSWASEVNVPRVTGTREILLREEVFAEEEEDDDDDIFDDIFEEEEEEESAESVCLFCADCGPTTIIV